MLIGTVMAIALGRKAASQQAAQQEALQQQLAAQQAQQAALETQQQPQAGPSSASVGGGEKRQNPKAGRRNRTKGKAGEGTNEPAGDGVTVHDPAASARTPGGTSRKHKGPRQPTSSDNANVAPGSWRKRSANGHVETAAKAAAPSSNTDNVVDASGALFPNSHNDHASSSTAFGASTTHATKPTPTVGASSRSRGRGRASPRGAAHGSFSRNTDGPVTRPSRGRGRGGRGTTTQPEQLYQRAPVPNPPGDHLVDAAAAQPSSARAAGPQFLRQRAMERQGHEQAASGTLPEWRSRNPRHTKLKHLVEQQVEQNATQASPFPTLSQTTAGHPTLHLPAPIPAHTDRPMVRRPKPRSKARKSRADHYDLVVEAAHAATSVLDKLGLRCALFGSLASRLYGSARCPKDADLLVFPPPDQEELTEAEIKARIVDTDAHFFLKLPRDPSKEYRILWYKKDSGGRGQECKVDILTPGTMSLPYLRQEEVKWLHVRRSAVATDEHYKGKGKAEEEIGLDGVDTAADADNTARENDGPALPVCPFPVVLLHKLQGWSDHCVAPEKFKRNKQHQDAGDVRRLLALKHEVDTLLSASDDVKAIWTDTRLFPSEFQDVSQKRVRLFCRAFPQRKAEWMMLGFNTELMPGDAEEGDEAVRKAVEAWTVVDVEDQSQEEEGDEDGQE